MTAVIKGLYYSYTITSQSYLTARSIINSINTLDELYIAAEPDTAVKLIAEPVGAITVTEYYIGSTAFFYITNYY
jgi:hypothetical protein